MIRCLSACRSLGLMAVAMATWAAPAVLPFKPSPVPGGVAIVTIPGQGPAPKVTYHGESVLVRRAAKGWVAVVGIPLGAKPGRQEIQVGGRSIPFTIRPKRYPEQRIRLKDERRVTPNAEDEARIAREQALMAPAWRAWPEGLVPTLQFQQPTLGGLTSSFGLRRVFNGQPRAPHSGLDIKAPAGQAVRAPAAGVVVLTGDFFFSGNAVFLAHGEGVVSLFAHLSKVTVTQGQVVKAGDLLGEVGMTGRATGPHLHWSLSLNNARVDPRLFL
ncbi:peptidoglycan DD-metalloendopeptidase family protein [Geothrix alkalitolerans]|uniref:peptidoglycan DD-metalloendopeptidase family protein n=1 Tax=Geothrix alkalitolerans TaxID=2922724 RepID=UPI001FAEF1B3|nr:peptidoglycan DD-metalloendopeptidase family protein [Geothrix alkalitolerans]